MLMKYVAARFIISVSDYDNHCLLVYVSMSSQATGWPGEGKPSPTDTGPLAGLGCCACNTMSMWPDSTCAAGACRLAEEFMLMKGGSIGYWRVSCVDPVGWGQGLCSYHSHQRACGQPGKADPAAVACDLWLRSAGAHYGSQPVPQSGSSCIIAAQPGTFLFRHGCTLGHRLCLQWTELTTVCVLLPCRARFPWCWMTSRLWPQHCSVQCRGCLTAFMQGSMSR